MSFNYAVYRNDKYLVNIKTKKMVVNWLSTIVSIGIIGLASASYNYLLAHASGQFKARRD